MKRLPEINESEPFSELSMDTALAAKSKKITRGKISKENFVASYKDNVCTFIVILKHVIPLFFQ